jgi:hypothetical protein
MITDREFGRGMLVLNIIWCIMLLSLAIYLFAGLLVTGNLQTSANEDSYTVLKSVLYILTCLILLATWYMRKFFLSRKVQSVQTTSSQALDHPALQKYFVASIMSWALSDAIGVFGFIIFLIGRNITDLYIFIFIAAISMFQYRPKKQDIIGLAEENPTGSTDGNSAT